METLVAKGTSTAEGPAATAETLDTAGTVELSMALRTSATAKSAEAQEQTAGTLGDANNGRDARTRGNASSRLDVTNNRIASNINDAQQQQRPHQQLGFKKC